MAIVMILTSILVGLAATVAALIAGQPLWLALALYPLAGTLALLGVAALAVLSPRGQGAAIAAPLPPAAPAACDRPGC